VNKGKLWGKIGGTPTFDKDNNRWMMSLVGLFLPAKRAYGRNGPHAMERRRGQMAKGMLRVVG
jgi:hypothetical protein